jgi:hypothetical protein
MDGYPAPKFLSKWIILSEMIVSFWQRGSAGGADMFAVGRGIVLTGKAKVWKKQA